MAGVGSNLGESRSRLSDLRELEEKLKCLVCKKLLQQPTLMTCGHIFCKECIPKYMVSLCPICKARFLSRNLKPAVDIEEMLKKYQEMEASILTWQSNQQGSGLLMNNSCHQDLTQSGEARSPAGDKVSVPPVPPGFKKKALELGIKSSSNTTSAKLTRLKPPRDWSAVAPAPFKSLTTPGASQVNVPAVQQEFQLRPPKFKMRANESCSKDSCAVHTVNPSTSKKKRTDREEWARPSVKRLKLLSSRVPVGLYEDECIFCHSFRRDLEGFGELFCIQKGKIVSEPDSAKARVLYAHEECLQWCPRIYYQGDQIMNLRNEIQRASKLNCAKCGLNGAALGCYYETCPKSYHPPCAYQVRGCRWDTENYCMLCPDHASEKLPCNSCPNPSYTEANGSGGRPTKREGANQLEGNVHRQKRKSK